MVSIFEAINFYSMRWVNAYSDAFDSYILRYLWLLWFVCVFPYIHTHAAVCAINSSNPGTSTDNIHSLLYYIYIYLNALQTIPFLPFLFSIPDACSSRTTPKPRPPTPSPRPNITFHTYKCPPAYADWYCLNDATCFTIKIADSLLYNCE